MARIVSVISGGMTRSRSDPLSFPLLRYELAPPLCDLLRDFLIPAAEERTDGDAKGGLVRKPGLKGRRAVPGFVARHLHARRGAEEIGKPRLSQMRVAAITAKVVIKWPSVNVFHGSTKNRRLIGSSVESETFRERELQTRGRAGENFTSEGLFLHPAEISRSEPKLHLTL